METKKEKVEMAVIRTREAKAETKPVYRTYEDFDYNKLNLYAGLDCIATSRVLSKVFPRLVDRPEFIESISGDTFNKVNLPALIDVNEDVTLKALDYILDLEINGMRYDCEENRRIHTRMTEEIGQLEDSVFKMIGKEIKYTSGVEMQKFLYGERGFTAPHMTTSGEPSTDGDALLILAGIDPKEPGNYVPIKEEYQYLASLAKLKDIGSSHNMFIKNYIDDFVDRDGRIRAKYNLYGTSSFRLTGDSPNFTQLPRPKHGYNIRDCYTADVGEVFLAFDFSSAEMKILACLSGDEAMKDACVKGFDFHTFTASTMLGVPYDDFKAILKDKNHKDNFRYKQLRQGAKAVGFGIVYGSSVRGISLGLNISEDEAKALINLYFDRFPKVKTFIETSHNQAKLNNVIVTPFGQRRQEYGTLPCFKKTAAYNAALRNSQNCAIQSPTSTLGLVTFAELNIKGMKPLMGKALSTVYDSCEWTVPLARAAEAVEAGFKYMNDWPMEFFPWMDVPIGVECELGTSWGNAEVVHRGITQAEIVGIIQSLKS